MPLDKPTREHVINYVLRDLVPRSVQPRPPRPMDWFTALFSFTTNEQLRAHLGEAFYQARFLGRFREAMGLSGGFNHAFTKSQILLYASIYEAVVDWIIEQNMDDPIIVTLRSEDTWKEQKDAFGCRTSLRYVLDS